MFSGAIALQAKAQGNRAASVLGIQAGIYLVGLPGWVSGWFLKVLLLSTVMQWISCASSLVTRVSVSAV